MWCGQRLRCAHVRASGSHLSHCCSAQLLRTSGAEVLHTRGRCNIAKALTSAGSIRNARMPHLPVDAPLTQRARQERHGFTKQLRSGPLWQLRMSARSRRSAYGILSAGAQAATAPDVCLEAPLRRALDAGLQEGVAVLRRHIHCGPAAKYRTHMGHAMM